MEHQRQRLFVDMDGTLAVFQAVDELETLYQEGYFLNLAPHENVVEAIREIMQSHPEIEVNILSAVLSDSQYALQEKNAWLDKYLPEIDAEHRIFGPCGSDKKDWIIGGVKDTDFLLDDYTKNLVDWHPPGRGIKLLNAINHSRGSWQHDRIRYDREPKDLAEGVVSVIRGNENIYDERPPRLEAEEEEDMADQNLIQVQSASIAAIDGYVVMAVDNSIYLGKRENYDNAGIYNNSDNSLIAISENPKMFSFLDATEGWVLTQQEMVAQNIFSEDDYNHYAGVKEILASQYGLHITHEKKFGIDISTPNSGTPFQYPNWEGMENPDIKDNLFFIARYYVVQDLQKQGALDIEYYRDIDAAIEAYRTLPADQMKAIGINSQTEPGELPGSIDLIHCRNGVDTVLNDYAMIGWDNPEVKAAISYISKELANPTERYHGDTHYLVEAADYARTLSSGSMSTFARQAGVGIDTSNYDALDALQAYVVEYLENKPYEPNQNLSVQVLEACRQYEAERQREQEPKPMRNVAIESTEDYTDPSFHQNLIDDDIQNEDGSYGKVQDYYRIVGLNENGRVNPVDNRVFNTYEAAVAAINADDTMQRIPYDDLINRAGAALGRNMITIDGSPCIVTDHWQEGTADYTVGRVVDQAPSDSFYMASVKETQTGYEGTYAYEFDAQPTREEVEGTHIDHLSMISIDRQEARAMGFNEREPVLRDRAPWEEDLIALYEATREPVGELRSGVYRYEVTDNGLFLRAGNTVNFASFEEVEQRVRLSQRVIDSLALLRDEKMVADAPIEQIAALDYINNPMQGDISEDSKGVLRLKDLKGYSEKIWEYCFDKDYYIERLNALNEDLAVDAYQDTQPGGGGLAAKNRSEYDEYAEKLNSLSGENVFGDLYQRVNAEGKALLDDLLKVCSVDFEREFEKVLDRVHQRMQFMEFVSDLAYAEKEFAAEDISLITKGGDHFISLVKDSYDLNKDKFTFTPNVDTAKTFLAAEGLMTDTPAEQIATLDYINNPMQGNLTEDPNRHSEMLKAVLDVANAHNLSADVKQRTQYLYDAYRVNAPTKNDFQPMIAVLQLSESDKNHGRRFIGLDALARIRNESPDCNNYELIYVRNDDGKYNGEAGRLHKVEELYAELNRGTPHPDNYYGHSPSVGDVVVLFDGVDTYHPFFIDSVGCKALGEDWLTPQMKAKIHTQTDIRKESELYNTITVFEADNIINIKTQAGTDRAFEISSNYEKIFEMADRRKSYDRISRSDAIEKIASEYDGMATGTVANIVEALQELPALEVRDLGFGNEEIISRSAATEVMLKAMGITNINSAPGWAQNFFEDLHSADQKAEFNGEVAELAGLFTQEALETELDARDDTAADGLENPNLLGYSTEAIRKAVEFLESYTPPANRYRLEAFGLEGTAQDLWIEARNGYVEDYNALNAIAYILHQEGLDNVARHVEFMAERALENPNAPYSLAQMKIDALGGVYQLIDDVKINEDGPNDLRLSVYQENGQVIVSLRNHAEDGAINEGASVMTSEELFAMTGSDFSSFVGQVYSLNMVEIEPAREQEREPKITILFKDEKNDIEAGINADGDLYLSNSGSGYNLSDTIENRQRLEADILRYTGQTVDLVGDLQEIDQEEPLVDISNLAFDDEGYLHFTVEADGYELEGLYRIHDPANGEDHQLVSIDFGDKHPVIQAQWDRIEGALHDFAVAWEERDLANAPRVNDALTALAHRLDEFAYNHDYYGYADDVGIDAESRAEHRAHLAEALANTQYSPMIDTFRQIISEEESYDELDSAVLNEARDLLYSLEHLDLYQKYYDPNREPNAENPIVEFQRDGRTLEGHQIPGRHIPVNSMGLADRRDLFEAVQSFEENNNIPYNQRVIHDGTYEDKDFLYEGYDRYVAMSHRNDLSIQPYLEKLQETAVVKDGRSPLLLIAEIYYAQRNGLTEQQIDFMVETIKDIKWPVDTLKTLRHGFEGGLTQDQLRIVAAANNFTVQDNLLEFFAEGATVEMAEAIKDSPVVGLYYIMHRQMLDGTLKTDMAKAITDSAVAMKQWTEDALKKEQAAGNPNARWQMSEWDIEAYCEFFMDSAIANPNLTPEVLKDTVKNYLETAAPGNLITYVRENDCFGMNPKQEEREVETMAEEKEATQPQQEQAPQMAENAQNAQVKERQERVKNALAETKDPKEAMHQEIANGVKDILNSEDFKNWLDTNKMMFYNNYSFNNAMLVWCQRPDATYTMGFEQWKKFGQCVKKGAEGIKIFVPVTAYEKGKDSLWGMIKSELIKDHKANPNNEYAVYRVGLSNIEITMNQNGLYGIRKGGKELGIQTEDQMKDFIKKSVLGKVAMYFSVGTVFDAKDVAAPEHLWLKTGFEKKDMVLDENGNPVKNRKGEYKIVNTAERQARFKPYLQADIKEIDGNKATILYESLKAVSRRNNITVHERTPEEDKELRGAKGYYSRAFDKENPKGFIVMRSDLSATEKVSVLLHEMSHSELHGNLTALAQRMGEDKIPSSMREIQAEAVAYVVGKDYGIETSTSSFQYLAHYTKGFEMEALKKSMEVIYNECKQLTKELKAELETRGLNMDLTPRSNEPMAKETVDTLAKAYAEYAVFRSRELSNIEKELPAMIMQYESDPHAKDLLLQQKGNVAHQSEAVTLMKAQIDALSKAKTLDEQTKCLDNLESAKSRLGSLNHDFNEMSDRFQKMVREGAELKDKFVTNPENALQEMKKSYPALDELSPVQLSYIAQSEYISRTFTPLLREDPEAFVKNVCDRASHLHEVISKNGVFVEIPFCEQWTDQPIVNGGALMHPRVADAIIKQGEMQIRGLKAEAEKYDKYFPYTKCAVTVFQTQKGANGPELQSYRTRVDLGDGEQLSLTDHLKQMSGAKGFVDNFEKSTRELKAKEKIVFNEKWKQPEKKTRSAASKETPKERTAKEEPQQKKEAAKQKEQAAKSTPAKSSKKKRDDHEH